MYDYIVLAIPWIRTQLDLVANAMKTGIRDVLPTDNDDDEDAISLKFFEKRRALGQLLIIFLDLTLVVTKGSLPYGSLMISVTIS